MQTETHEARYGRGRFLRQLGISLTFALGAGGLASFAGATHAAGHCCFVTECPVSDPPPPTCNEQDGFRLYHCNCTGISQNYCGCFHSQQSCLQGPC
jgi:hypothetical protein